MVQATGEQEILENAVDVAKSADVPAIAVVGEGVWADRPPYGFRALGVHRLIQNLHGPLIPYRIEKRAQKVGVDPAVQYLARESRLGILDIQVSLDGTASVARSIKLREILVWVRPEEPGRKARSGKVSFFALVIRHVVWRKLLVSAEVLGGLRYR